MKSGDWIELHDSVVSHLNSRQEIDRHLAACMSAPGQSVSECTIVCHFIRCKGQPLIFFSGTLENPKQPNFREIHEGPKGLFTGVSPCLALHYYLTFCGAREPIATVQRCMLCVKRFLCNSLVRLGLLAPAGATGRGSSGGPRLVAALEKNGNVSKARGKEKPHTSNR